MHVVHTILVQLPVDESGKPLLDSCATAVADAIPSLEGPGAWYDWWSVGGRWDGYFASMFPELALEDGNVLPVQGNEIQVLRFLEQAQRRIDTVFCEQRDMIVGTAVGESDVDGYIFGLPVAADAQTAQERTRENKEVAGEWQKILTLDSIASRNTGDGMTWASYRPLYAIQTMTELINGTWNDESGYLDSVARVSHPSILADVLRNPSARRADDYQMDRLALVAVDFHF